MALTTIPSELSSVSGIADSSDATAITIDSSENVKINQNLSIGTTSTEGILNLAGQSNLTWGTDYSAIGSIPNSQGLLLGNNKVNSSPPHLYAFPPPFTAESLPATIFNT